MSTYSGGQVIHDEYGNPYVIIEEQGRQQRSHGLEAHKANIIAAKCVAESIRTSLGPKGMDKMIVGPDGDVTVTNDGATILSKMDVSNEIAKLLVNLSTSQDDEIGDGTTGIVIMAGALLSEALKLLEKGVHPLRIASGYEKSCDIACKRVIEISKTIDIMKDDHAALKKAAMTALGSKIVSSKQSELASICVEAVLSVADLERKDVNFDLIKIESKAGGKLEDTKLIRGIVLDKDLAHPQMPKTIKNAKIAILACPFEPPKPKTKYKVEIRTAADYHKLHDTEQKYFLDMIKKVKDTGANLVICQWGFDDEATHLLYQEGLPAIRWVGGVEMELIAMGTNGRIVPRFEELTAEKLGFAGSVREVTTGTAHDTMLIIEDCSNTKTVTILARGGNQMSVNEAVRCLHDANCCVRNLILKPEIIPGGGASEIAAALAVLKEAEFEPTIDLYTMNAFAAALENIPEILAENSGLDCIQTVTSLKAKHLETGNGWHGVDAMGVGTTDMDSQDVYETLSSKVNQFRLATQVVKMVLKIDDVIQFKDEM